jgi:hypothetical protein
VAAVHRTTACGVYPSTKAALWSVTNTLRIKQNLSQPLTALHPELAGRT